MTSNSQVQFVAIFVHSFQLLFRDCDYPTEFVYWIGSHAILFWFLFWDFFKKTYLSSKSRSSASRQTVNGKRNGSASYGPLSACCPTEQLLNLMNGEDEDGKSAKSMKKPPTNGSVAIGCATSNGSLTTRKSKVSNNQKKKE
jgi:hypothetical protein